jgi:hypothetical protein
MEAALLDYGLADPRDWVLPDFVAFDQRLLFHVHEDVGIDDRDFQLIDLDMAWIRSEAYIRMFGLF